MGDDRPEPQRPGRTTGSSVLTPPTGMPVVPGDAGSLLETPPSADAAVPCAEPVPADPAPVAPAPTVPVPAARWIPPDDPAYATQLASSCLCGHGAPAHEHWRRGSDCGVCGAADCPAFRRRGGHVRRVLRRLRLVG